MTSKTQANQRENQHYLFKGLANPQKVVHWFSIELLA